MTRALLVMHGAASAADRPTHARLATVLELMREHGADITVALADDPGGLRADLRSVVPVHVLPVGLAPAAASLLDMPRAVGYLRSLFRAVNPDVIEADEPTPAVATGLAALPGAIPLIYRRHHHSGRLRLRVMSRLASQLADYTAVSNEALVERVLADDGAAVDRVLIVPSGLPELRHVSDAERVALRDHLGIPQACSVVVAVARLRREKGIDVLLAALGRLQQGSVSAVIAGDGPERSALQATARSLPCAVHLVSHQDDIAPLLAIADVVAIPSRREAFGRTTLQAMAAGKPIVATRVGGLVNAVEDGVNGFLVAREDPAGMAAALARVLGDPILAREMGEAGRGRFESRHTASHMAEAWLAAWDTAAAGARSRRWRVEPRARSVAAKS